MARRSGTALVAAALLLIAGCRFPHTLRIHYLPGFVPGTRNVFAAARVTVATAGASGCKSPVAVGAIFDPTGKLERKLYARNPPRTVARALTGGLDEAGLKAALRDSSARAKAPPGADYAVVFNLETLEVNKRFGAEMTVHGRYFTMNARVRIAVETFDRQGRRIYVGESEGDEDEPPKPVGGEAFLPLETDPAEALSVALSRAVGALIVEMAKRKIFPARGDR